ncbi:MAG TPA: helix-turn-helix domain-containing protein [Candidatus Bathyarchaeia archaeon]|nr:helix-turn-helix domain-containing protein [Candidatus Bathyarchaeia archaeon]
MNKERCFTVKQAAKLLGVSTKTVKRRIKNKELITEERIGRRGPELVIPQRALNLEIMSFVPTVHQLTLSDFEAIIVKRFEAMAAGRDQRVSKALKELRKEYAQLTAELNGFQTVFSEATALPAAERKAESPVKQNLRARQSSSPQRTRRFFRFSKNE